MLKLLIADDEAFVRKGLIKNIPFKDMGIDEVEQADDGIAALQIASAFMPDIILSDIRMPNMNGIELATRIREVLPDCKIIFMSAYSDKEYLKSAISLKAISYVEKPIDLDEIKQAIMSAVELCREEKANKTNLEEMKSTVKESLFLAKSNTVLDLVNSKANLEYITEVLSAKNIGFKPEDYYTVLVTKLKNPDLQQFQIQGYLEAIHTVHHVLGLYGISGYKSNGHIITILQEKAKDKKVLNREMLLHIGWKITTALKERQESFVGIGKPVAGLKNIHESYEAGVMALQKLFFRGYGNCAMYQEACQIHFQFEERIIQDFRSTLEEDESVKCIELLKSTTKNFKTQEEVLPNYIKDVYFRLLQVLFEVARKRGMEASEVNSEAFYWHNLTGYETLNEVEEYLVNKVEAFYEVIKATSAGSKIVTGIMKVVDKEYANEELSIKAISQSIFLSEAYLCVIFKNETGKTINQYITEVRIEKAKEFLKDKNIKVSDIARKVGYSDHNYFTKIFKKVTNMTPSEYKERFLV